MKDDRVCFVFSSQDQEQLKARLAGIEKKIIVGGENLLEKAEEQERMLEQSAKELEERKANFQQLQKEVEEKEVGISSVLLIHPTLAVFTLFRLVAFRNSS